MSSYLRNMLMNCEGEVNLLNVPITFEAIQDNSNVIFTTFNGTPSGSVRMQYRLGTSGGWIDYTPGDALPNLNKGESIQFQNLLEETFSYGPYVSSKRYGFSTSSGLFKVYGNIQSLMNWSETLPACAFRFLFRTTKIYDASNLLFPAELTQDGCYLQTFSQCKDLVHAPREFPSKVIPFASYQYLFRDCSNLIDAPEFLGDEIGSSGGGEFLGCFENCTSLQKPPSNLYPETLQPSTYSNMFYNCSSLLYPPVIHATSSDQCSFRTMFSGCKSMIRCPELKNLSNCQYESFMYMFLDCESITEVPEFPQVEEIRDRSFFGTFKNCKSIRNVNFLIHSSPWLGISTFGKLFDGCSNLSYIKTNITSWDTGTKFENWVNGVANSGTFEAPETLPFKIGESNIPKGWEIIGPKGISAEDCEFEFFTNIEETKDLQINSIPDNYTLEVIEGVIPNGLELTSDGKIKGNVNETGTFQIKIKITNTGFEKTINVSISCYDGQLFNPVFYYPCINENLVYVKNEDLKLPFYFNNGSQPITFSSDESGINYLHMSNQTGIYNYSTLEGKNLSTNQIFKGSTSFSVFFRLKFNETFTSGNKNLFNINTTGTAMCLRVGLGYNSEGGFIHPYVDNYNCGDTDTFSFGSLSDRALNLGQWYDIVVTYDRSTNTYKCYIDKVHKTTSSPRYYIALQSTDAFKIGSWTEVPGWKGSIDSQLSDITIWTKVLTDEEIQSL